MQVDKYTKPVHDTTFCLQLPIKHDKCFTSACSHTVTHTHTQQCSIKDLSLK